MNRNDITRMAREAGVLSGYESDLFVRFAVLVQAYEREMCASLVEEMVKHNDGLDDFANSVRKGGRRLCSDGRPKWLKISMEVAAEREACARVCDDKVNAEYATGKVDHHEIGWTQACAIAIRARGDV